MDETTTIGDVGDTTIADLDERSIKVMRGPDGWVWVVQGVMSLTEALAVLSQVVDGERPTVRRMTLVLSLDRPAEMNGCGDGCGG